MQNLSNHGTWDIFLSAGCTYHIYQVGNDIHQVAPVTFTKFPDIYQLGTNIYQHLPSASWSDFDTCPCNSYMTSLGSSVPVSPATPWSAHSTVEGLTPSKPLAKWPRCRNLCFPPGLYWVSSPPFLTNSILSSNRLPTALRPGLRRRSRRATWDAWTTFLWKFSGRKNPFDQCTQVVWQGPRSIYIVIYMYIIYIYSA